jgi:anti-sigma B factor antagonist
MTLTLRTQVSGDIFIVECEGRIVFGDEGATLRERVRGLLSGTPKIVVNLRQATHIDSGGIGILVGFFVSARNRGGDLKLVSPSGQVADVLHRTHLDEIFAAYRTCDEAVAAFPKQVA